MSLEPGSKLGPYEIEAAIGAGGMGEVYRAKDSRLDRTVAIKILPAHLSEQPDLKARFEREARAVSKFSHPNICGLYDIGNQDGVDFLVMEFLDGETLGEYLAKNGKLQIDQLLRIGIQIAEALDAAHREGIVHRDLKPGNVMLTASGVKLLDFGLAKSTDVAGGPIAAGLSGMVTGGATGDPLTAEGTILGTLQYMSPEQLEGGEADSRTDIFALGAILYEMATGKKAFDGASQASLISSIMSTDPPSISSIDVTTPPALDWAIRTCLAKNPDERFRSAHDLQLQLQWLRQGSSQIGVPAPVVRRRISRERIAWAVALLLFVVAGFTTAAFVRTSGESTQVVRASLLPPAGNTYRFGPLGGPLMISPDGTRIIFSATDEEGNEMLWVRPLDAGSGHPIPGTQGGVFPFWSPDSRWIGFFAVDELKKVDLSGTPPITLCSASNGRSGSWNKDGTIIFGVNPGGIMRVAQVGGEPVAVTVPDSTIGENTHRWPQFLPDGKHFLYFARKSQGSPDNAVWISSLDGGERELLIRGQSNAVYASGYMMFLRDGTLMAQPFNADSRKLEGEAFPIAEDIQYFAAWSRGTLAASETGVLVYQTGGGSAGSKLALMDREGNLLEKVGEDLVHRGPVFSPGEEEIVVAIMDVAGAQSDLWIYEVTRGLRTRFTFANATGMGSPVFSRDGKLVAYSATLDNSGSDLYIKPMYGSGEATLILETDVDKQPSDFSPDGKYLIYHHRGIENTWDVARIALDSGAVPEDLIATPFFEDGAVISHDGSWIAYASTETGQYEVYVTRYPDLGRKWQISARGGDFPNWIKGGREIVYLSPDGMLHAVSVEASGDNFRVGEDKELFEINQNLYGVPYDVTESGDRFLTSDPDLVLSTGPATLVLNWDEELKNR